MIVVIRSNSYFFIVQNPTCGAVFGIQAHDHPKNIKLGLVSILFRRGSIVANPIDKDAKDHYNNVQCAILGERKEMYEWIMYHQELGCSIIEHDEELLIVLL